jgi:hypothetical protein
MKLAIAQLTNKEEPIRPTFVDLSDQDIDRTVGMQVQQMRTWTKTKEGLKVLERTVRWNEEELDRLDNVLLPFANKVGGTANLVSRWRGQHHETH